MQELEVRSISVISIFKLVGVGLFFSLMPTMIILGIVCGLGLLSMTYNGEILRGWWPVLMGPIFGLFLVTVLTAVVGIAMTVGLWIYSLIGPTSISFKPVSG